MNKKIIIVTSISILLFAVILVVAQVLSANNTTASLSKASKDALEGKGLTDIITSDCIPINLDKCEYRMYDGNYNLGTHKIPIRYCDTFNETLDINNETTGECLSYTDYTTQEIEDFVDAKSENWLENYGQVLIQRDAVANLDKSPKTLGGDVTITEK